MREELSPAFHRVCTGLAATTLALLVTGCETLEHLQSVEGEVAGETTGIEINNTTDLGQCEVLEPKMAGVTAVVAAVIPLAASFAKSELDRTRENVLEEYEAKHSASVSPSGFSCLRDRDTFTYTRKIPGEGGPAFKYVGKIETATVAGEMEVAKVTATEITFHHAKARHARDQGVHLSMKMKFSYFAEKQKAPTGLTPVSTRSITLFDGNLEEGDACGGDGGDACDAQSGWFILPFGSPGTMTIAVVETGKGQDAARRASNFLNSLVDVSIDYAVTQVEKQKDAMTRSQKTQDR